jgi:hypothetical protein
MKYQLTFTNYHNGAQRHKIVNELPEHLQSGYVSDDNFRRSEFGNGYTKVDLIPETEEEKARIFNEEMEAKAAWLLLEENHARMVRGLPRLETRDIEAEDE